MGAPGLADKPLEGQVALVTGANSGIGEAAARCLGEAGARVCVNYVERREDALRVVAGLEEAGSSALAIEANVSEEDDVDRMFDEAIGQFGRLDILVSNAGIQRDADFVDMSLEQWNAVLDVNLTGGFLCAQRAVRHFIRRGVDDDLSRAAGKVVFISSVHEVIPWAGHVNYAVSKGGISLLMRSLAQEVAHHHIRVNSVAPGAIQTPINRSAWQSAEARSRLLELIPYGRVGAAEDVGKAVVWLASDASDYVTGATLFIDGGMTLYPGFSEGGG
jgi:glucose 1-dehydrogenase